MFEDLRANPEVLWGALIAFGIVVLLTPAVGGMARLLGVVDAPGERRLNKRPIPRLGALAFSVYVVYLLEIVKLANPRVRRRRTEAEDPERLSA